MLKGTLLQQGIHVTLMTGDPLTIAGNAAEARRKGDKKADGGEREIGIG